jgi:hypothetical protein
MKMTSALTKSKCSRELVDEIEENADKIEKIGADTRESLFQTSLATADSMIKTFGMPTSTRSKRLTSPEALVPGPVLLRSTLKEPSSSKSNPNVVDCDAADEDALINLSTMKEPSSSQTNPTVVQYDAADEDVPNHSTTKTQIERAMIENDGDYEIVCTVSQLKEYVDAEKTKVAQEMSETQAHQVLHGLADRFKISRMQDIKNTGEVAYYCLHNQTKEMDPATGRGKIFVRERSVELCHALQDVKEEMRAPIVKALAKRYGLLATEKVFKRSNTSSQL